MKGTEGGAASAAAPVPDTRSVLRVAYFFAGAERKASIEGHLQRMCDNAGVRLHMETIDIMVGGKAHNLLSREIQDAFIARVEEGSFDMIIFSPPCATWSRAPWANRNGPLPCRDAKSPWGFTDGWAHDRARADVGNEFVHFTLRGIHAAIACTRKKHKVCRSLWEHPEDLGRMQSLP